MVGSHTAPLVAVWSPPVAHNRPQAERAATLGYGSALSVVTLVSRWLHHRHAVLVSLPVTFARANADEEGANPLINGEPCWIRTSDLLIKSQLLYRLS